MQGSYLIITVFIGCLYRTYLGMGEKEATEETQTSSGTVLKEKVLVPLTGRSASWAPLQGASGGIELF